MRNRVLNLMLRSGKAMNRVGMLWWNVGILWFMDFSFAGISARSPWTFPLDARSFRGFPEPVWIASDLSIVLKRYERDERKWLEEQSKNAFLYKPAPMSKFPGWAQCQEIGLRRHPRMILARVNMAAVKAARALLRGAMDIEFEDSLGRDLPFSFDARDWGEAVLFDIHLRGRSKKEMLSLLSREADGLRYLFSETRDQINRDVLWEYHAWERASKETNESAKNAAAWRLWVTMGCPKP